jgi:glutathione S-transferase
MADGDFLVGKAVSLADLYLAPMISYFGKTPEGKVIMGRLPKLTAWWEGFLKRPAMLETVPQTATAA